MTSTADTTRPPVSIVRRVIVGLIVVSFGAAAVGGIVVLLGTELGEPAWKVLSTTMIVGAFSVAVLCCVSLVGRRLQAFGYAGATVATVAAVLALVALWAQPSWEWQWFWDLLWTAVAATVTMSFASLLLLLADRRRRGVRIGLIITLALFAVVFLMIVWPLWTDEYGGEFYSRALGILSILAALGAIIVPVLSLLLREGSAEPPVAAEPHVAVESGLSLSPESFARIVAEARRLGISPDALVAQMLPPAPIPAEQHPA